ncbi:amidohydrolase, partial [Virgibacillus sp. 7505]
MKAIVNGLVWTGIANQPAVPGTVLVEGACIKEVGIDVVLPEGVEKIDAKGGWVTPGLIDVHTHLGVHTQGLGNDGHDFNETTAACT